MSRSKFFQLALIVFIIGATTGSFLDASANIWTLLLVFAAFFVLGSIGKLKELFTGSQTLFYLILPITFIVGALYVSFYRDKYRSADFSVGQGMVLLTGRVEKEPEPSLDNQKVEFSPENYSGGKILLTLDRHTNVKYGDRISIYGRVKEPVSNGDFDYKSYLLMRGITTVSYFPEVKVIGADGGNFILSALYSLRRSFNERIGVLYNEPHASLLSGLLLGTRKSMSQSLVDSFNRTGTTHIVAISGYNITIIAVIFLSSLLALGLARPKAFYFAVAGIILFTLFTGASASVIRAAIMGILILIAQKFGRLSSATNALFFAAAVMLLINPMVVRFDAGFQLSFLSTMGLIYIVPWLEKKFVWLTNKFELRTMVAATLAAQIAVLPVLIYNFGQMSVIAPLANILVLPFIPLAMLLGFLSTALSFLWLPLGRVIGMFGWVVLDYEIKIITFLSNFSFSSFTIAQINIFWVILYYLGLVLFLLRWRKNSQPIKQVSYASQ